jgi:membrane associated rhomboid family serine protease
MQITYIIIIFTCLFSYWAFQNREVMVKFKHWPYQEARRGEYYRWLTGGFLHGDAMHLIFNMLTLYFFAADQRPDIYRSEGIGFGGLEAWFGQLLPTGGPLLFLVFYLAAIVAASSATFVRYRDTPSFASIGASGATAAVLFAAILLEPTMRLSLMFLPIPIPGFIFGAIYLWYSAYAARKGGDNIDHTAHYFGAIFGFALPAVLQPSLITDFFEKITTWFSSF